MSNLRQVNEDILRDWMIFRDETISSLRTSEDRKHLICFDSICDSILKSIPKQNRPYVQKQLNKLDDNFMDHLGYLNEKYFRNGFCDAIQLICGSID